MAKTFPARFIVTLAAFLLLAVGPFAAQAKTPGAVTDLAWMTGAWRGALGEGFLEENWNQPVGGSIASLVRMTGKNGTSMVELVVVEEEQGTLVLRLQQFDPGFKPRTAKPLTMVLTSLGENSVTFEGVEPGGLKKLTYARPEVDTFTVFVETAEGAEFTSTMQPQ